MNNFFYYYFINALRVKKTSYNKMSPTEVVLNMISNPELWQNEPIIKVANDELASELGAINNYVSFNQLFDFDNGGAYRLLEKVDPVYQKEQNARNKYDKEIIYVDERINICYQIFEGKLFNIFPNLKNTNEKWTAPQLVENYENPHENEQMSMQNNMPPKGMGGMSDEQINALMEKNSMIPIPKVENKIETLFINYLHSVTEAYKSGNWDEADLQLNAIENYQIQNGGQNIPSTSRISAEIAYNKLNLFGKLGIVYYKVLPSLWYEKY